MIRAARMGANATPAGHAFHAAATHATLNRRNDALEADRAAPAGDKKRNEA